MIHGFFSSRNTKAPTEVEALILCHVVKLLMNAVLFVACAFIVVWGYYVARWPAGPLARWRASQAFLKKFKKRHKIPVPSPQMAVYI